jgi:membrane protease YdiL (CAAX protease family)
VRINFHDTQSVAMYVLLFVVTAPVCEEILYRGFLVAWLRRVGWRDSAIWLASSLIFGANHLIPLGLVWSRRRSTGCHACQISNCTTTGEGGLR